MKYFNSPISALIALASLALPILFSCSEGRKTESPGLDTIAFIEKSKIAGIKQLHEFWVEGENENEDLIVKAIADSSQTDSTTLFDIYSIPMPNPASKIKAGTERHPYNYLDRYWKAEQTKYVCRNSGDKSIWSSRDMSWDDACSIVHLVQKQAVNMSPNFEPRYPVPENIFKVLVKVSTTKDSGLLLVTEDGGGKYYLLYSQKKSKSINIDSIRVVINSDFLREYSEYYW